MHSMYLTTIVWFLLIFYSNIYEFLIDLYI